MAGTLARWSKGQQQQQQSIEKDGIKVTNLTPLGESIAQREDKLMVQHGLVDNSKVDVKIDAKTGKVEQFNTDTPRESSPRAGMGRLKAKTRDKEPEKEAAQEQDLEKQESPLEFVGSVDPQEQRTAQIAILQKKYTAEATKLKSERDSLHKMSDSDKVSNYLAHLGYSKDEISLELKDFTESPESFNNILDAFDNKVSQEFKTKISSLQNTYKEKGQALNKKTPPPQMSEQEAAKEASLAAREFVSQEVAPSPTMSRGKEAAHSHGVAPEYVAQMEKMQKQLDSIQNSGKIKEAKVLGEQQKDKWGLDGEKKVTNHRTRRTRELNDLMGREKDKFASHSNHFMTDGRPAPVDPKATTWTVKSVS